MRQNSCAWMAAAGLAALAAVTLVLARDASALDPRQEESPPAIEVYKNLKMEMFRRMSKARVDRVMNVLNTVLGVECTHCHEQDNWANDNLPEEKRKPRKMIAKMFPMVGAISADHFEGKGGPTCWTCHRGSTEPAKFPATRTRVKIPEPSPFVNSQDPAEQVYKNIQQVKGLPARNLRGVMNTMAVALGVECSHCHVEGDWASDEKEPKRTARKMFKMRTAIYEKHFDGRNDVIFCWTCHRGSKEPERNPPR